MSAAAVFASKSSVQIGQDTPHDTPIGRRLFGPGFWLLLVWVTVAAGLVVLPASGMAADPPPELCNGIDDDDDDVIDEGFDVGAECDIGNPLGCTPGPGVECCLTQDAGIKECSEDGLSTVCQPKPDFPLVDISEGPAGAASCFDSIDNDCDGRVDHQETACQTAELCNGFDDDNDGQTDEDFVALLGTSCTVGTGFCARTGVVVCSADQMGTACSETPGLPSTENTPGTGKCLDGVDNDCDGLVDLADTGCQIAERCDGVDNDGDGRVDEDFSTLGAACSTGAGLCQVAGTFECTADGTGTACGAVPALTLASVEGPSGATCRDGVDNDCDGLVDLADTDCASADLAVSCALVPVKGASGRTTDGEPGTDCGGTFEVQFTHNADPSQVTAELLGLDPEGGRLGALAVQNGDLAHLRSRTAPVPPKVDAKGRFLDVRAPVPLLHVRANTGQRVAQAFCAPIPYVDVIAPAGEVVSASEGDQTEVVVALPQVAPSTLSVRVDGVDILAALGVDPGLDFPGGPFTGLVDIAGQMVTVTDLTVHTAPLGSLAANTLTMILENLGGGGHIVVVEGEPRAEALPAQTSAVCHLDDLRDAGTVAVFEIVIVEPEAGEVTNTVPTPVQAEVRHGRMIAGAQVNGLPVDVSGQVFMPGDGETAADTYMLDINVALPQADLTLPPQLGTFDRGQNEVNAGAEDDLGNLTFARQRFTVGQTVAPVVLAGLQASQAASSEAVEAALQSLVASEVKTALTTALADTINLDNAMVFGLSGEALQTYFASTCEAATPAVQAKIQEALTMAEFDPRNVDVPLNCDPRVTVDIPDVTTPDIFDDADSVRFDGVFECNVEAKDGRVSVDITIPDTIVRATATGHCRDDVGPVCISEVTIDAELEATLQNFGVTFDITEQLALEGGDSPLDIIQGTVASPTLLRGPGKIECNIITDVVAVLTGGLTGLILNQVFDPINLLIDLFIPDVFDDIDIAEKLRNSDVDPLMVQQIELNEDLIAMVAGLILNQELIDVQITPDGLLGTISIGFEVPNPDPESEETPEATQTAAPPPMLPVSGAKDAFSVFSDDAFGLLFAALTAQGSFNTACEPSGLTVGDILPTDCDALSGADALETAQKRGKCHGAKGDDCSALPLAQRPFCTDAQTTFANRNIATTTPLLFCARLGISPRLLVEDNAATMDRLEARTHVNDLRITIVLDRNGNDALDGQFLTTRGCFAPLSDTTADCKWGSGCFDLDVTTDLTLEAGGAEAPRIVPQIPAMDAVVGAVGAQCEGGQLFGDNSDMLSQAGASDPVDIIGDNIEALTPLFQVDGLTLGGFVSSEEAMLLAIETQVEPDCTTCQEYVGVTSKLTLPPGE